tara:strand:+ start:1531 stop:1866 length:336 start_codon:yes stop_codon:yes gene_type:complete
VPNYLIYYKPLFLKKKLPIIGNLLNKNAFTSSALINTKTLSKTILTGNSLFLKIYTKKVPITSKNRTQKLFQKLYLCPIKLYQENTLLARADTVTVTYRVNALFLKKSFFE